MSYYPGHGYPPGGPAYPPQQPPPPQQQPYPPQQGYGPPPAHYPQGYGQPPPPSMSPYGQPPPGHSPYAHHPQSPPSPNPLYNNRYPQQHAPPAHYPSPHHGPPVVQSPYQQHPPPPTLSSHTLSPHAPSPHPPPNGPMYQGRPGPPAAYPNSYNHGNHGAPPPPPSAPVAFGHGAPAGYSFQYSNCTGKRKALLIGINYFGQRGQLRGCINDVKNMSTYLNQNFGYARDDMVILTDDQQNPMSQPTKANILRAMHWLVKDAKPNDSLFFHYSGHGGQTPDLDGDEEDGYDEVIYPVDFRSAGHIVDDEMHRIMVQSLMPGVRLTAIFDSCHSGSALDLPYIYSTQGLLKEPNLAKEAGQGLLSVVSAYARGDVTKVVSTALGVGVGLFKKASRGEEAQRKSRQTRTSPADVIMWSGSKDVQTSADTSIAGEATGAMSWAFISALKKNPQQSYVQLLNSIREELASKYTQKPQLSSSHPLGEYRPPLTAA